MLQCGFLRRAWRNCLSLIISSYRFSLPRPNDILGLPIGQHMSIAATIEGQPREVVRSYTPISSDVDPGYVDLLIKAYPTGNISKHVAHLKIGDTLKIKGPKGAMVYTPGMVRHFGMIAGGTGITPMLQIIRAIIRGRPRNGGTDRTEVDLLFANVNFEDILLKDDLDSLAKEDEGFRVHYVLNNPPEKWDGGVGFCTPEMIKVTRHVDSVRLALTSFPGETARPCARHQGFDLRAAPNGQRDEEGLRIPRVRETKACEQAPGPSFLFLGNSQCPYSGFAVDAEGSICSSHPLIR